MRTWITLPLSHSNSGLDNNCRARSHARVHIDVFYTFSVKATKSG